MMKRITVNAYEIALIMKRGKLVSVLNEGKHWIGFWEQEMVFPITEPLRIHSQLLAPLTASKLMEAHGTMVDIGDTEIGIEMKNGKFSNVLNTGTTVYWKSPIDYTVDTYDMTEIEVSKDIPKYILLKAAMQPYINVFPVESYQKGLLYIVGKFEKILDPGVYYYWKSEALVAVKTIDTRLQNMEVSGQELLTKDKAGIRVNFTAQYQVTDIEKALIDTKDYEKQLYTTLQLALREYISSMTLDQMLASKEAMGPYIVGRSQEAAAKLGITITAGGIKDVILPGDVKDIMNQVLIAQKKAQANTIMRQEETASTRSLLNTAKLMEQNAMLLKLKEMEYVEKISEKIGEITVNGGTGVIDQLKQLVVTK